MKLLRWVFSIIGALDRYDLPLFRVLSSRTKRRLVRAFYKPLVNFFKDTVKLNGMTFHVPRQTYYSYVLREHEPGTQSVMRRHIRPGMVVVDVGANIGYLTLLMAQLVGPGGKVYAVEPGDDNLDLLNKNIRLNGFTNVTVLPLVAGEKHQIRNLYMRKAGTLHTLHMQAGAVIDTVQVQEVALDEVIEGKVDLVKIDVEGGEMEVLKGMSRIRQSNPDLRLIVEWSPSALRRAGHAMEELPEFLIEEGFHLSVIDEDRQTAKSLDEILSLLRAGALRDTWYANLLAERAIEVPNINGFADDAIRLDLRERAI